MNTLAFVLVAQMLVSPDWLQQHLHTVTVLHAGSAADYAAGHIPGAVLVEMSSMLCDRDGTPNELPSIEALQSVFQAAGVNVRGRIVIYSTDPVLAARAWFTLDYLGQGNRVSILDGGYAKWAADGCLTTRVPAVAIPGSFEARPMSQAVIRLATLREVIRLRQQLGPNLAVIDTRAPAQYADAHIPGAVNVPFADHFNADGTLRPANELRALYRAAGVSKESANIAYCRTGMQAAVTYFVLRYLGYDAALYDGSYVEWTNAGETVWSRANDVASLLRR